MPKAANDLYELATRTAKICRTRSETRAAPRPQTQVRRLRRAVLLGVSLITVLYGPVNSFDQLGPILAQAAVGSPKLNLIDPRSLAQQPPSHPKTAGIPASNPSQIPPPGKLMHPVPMPMQPGSVVLDPIQPSQFLGSDGRFEIDVPDGAVTATDLAAAGGQLSLAVRQVAPASGSTGGGSGIYTFGTYLVQPIDGLTHEWNQPLRKPLTFKLHVSAREQAFDLNHVAMTFNGVIPADTNFNPDPSGPVISPAQANLASTTNVPANFDGTNSALVATTTMRTDPLVSFNTDSPDATFGRPDLFNADRSAGALIATYPIDVPSGPGGLRPPISLAYDSSVVNEQHNPQGGASWVGESWGLGNGLGLIPGGG